MRILILVLALGVAYTSAAGARPVTKTVKKAAKKVQVGKKSDLQTDVKFDDGVLHGQYQTPDELLTKVENEKGLSDLLGVRKHFKDRLATASEQE